MNTDRRRRSGTLLKIMASISEDDMRRTRDRMMVAVRIADALEAKGISQKRFAELMGRSESEISEWLSGDRNFTVDTLSDIGDCLNIRLLPGSEIRMRRISCDDSCTKMSRASKKNTYPIIGKDIAVNVTEEWIAPVLSPLALA